MVQFIKEYRKPSFSERLGNAGIAGSQAASEVVPAYIMAQEEKRIAKEKKTKENAALKKLGIDLEDVENEKIREKATELSLKSKFDKEELNLKDKQRKDLIKQISGGVKDFEDKAGFELTDDQKNSIADQLMSGRNATQGQLGSQNGQSQTAQNRPEVEEDPFKEAELYAAAGEHDLSQVAKDKAKTKIKSKEAKESALRAETLPVRKELGEKATAAELGIKNKENLLNLIKSGEINDPTYAALAEALPFNLGKRLLSPKTVEYKAGLIDEYKDLRTIFQGQTRVKEIDLLEQKIADIYLTDEQKEGILKSRINALKADIIRAEAAGELEREGKFYGALQFGREVSKRAKPKLDALFDQILDEQKSIIKNAENRKNIPLDINDPDDLQIIDQILEEANDDKKEALRIAKKKGYSW